MITDTHAHLYYPELISQIDETLYRAQDAGVERIIVPAVDLATSRTILELAEKYNMIYGALGIHPCEVKNNDHKTLDEIEKLLNHEKIVAIGETGLDYYWDTSNTESQKEFFKHQLLLSKEYNLPVIIHTRSSTEDAIAIVKENYDLNLKGQFHCFSGDSGQLSSVLEMENFYVSFCGNITYKNYKESEIILNCPENKILSETDSPFLPPVPYRGKRNEPSFITNTISKIAEIKSTDTEILKKNMYLNSKMLFPKMFKKE